MSGMTALIVSDDSHFANQCAAVLKYHGFNVAKMIPGQPLTGGSDITILDICRWDAALYGSPGGKLLAVISTAWRLEYDLPRGAMFFLKPVDMDFLLDHLIATVQEH
jgi:hypothetical protein